MVLVVWIFGFAISSLEKLKIHQRHSWLGLCLRLHWGVYSTPQAPSLNFRGHFEIMMRHRKGGEEVSELGRVGPSQCLGMIEANGHSDTEI